MGFLKSVARSHAGQNAIGALAARYLGLVSHTNRFVRAPEDLYGALFDKMPVIVAMWHGQHFMMHFAKRRRDRVASLVSRSRDGNLNAAVLRRVGVRTIRGSGARGRDQNAKGGAQATREMLRALQDGESLVMTADIPKISRQCGPGIVTLARLSGRPVVAAAVVTSRRIDFDSWDHASLGLPFGRGAMVVGEPIYVDRDADGTSQEAARLAVQRSLDDVHERAYALIGSTDPGMSAAGS